MIVLGIIPLRRPQDFRRDRFPLVPLLAHFLFNLGRDLHLLVVLDVHGRAVLRARVGALSVQRRRVVHLEEILQQLPIRDSVRVKDYEERLGVACPS